MSEKTLDELITESDALLAKIMKQFEEIIRQIEDIKTDLRREK